MMGGEHKDDTRKNDKFMKGVPFNIKKFDSVLDATNI